MTTAIEQNLVVAVTSPRPLTKEQRATAREELQASLPPHVLVIVLDAGMTAVAFPLHRGVEMVAGELAYDDTPAQILAELRGLRADIATHSFVAAAGIQRRDGLGMLIRD